MTKFRFFKNKLQKKGANIAKSGDLGTLLAQQDTGVDQETFKKGLNAAIQSKHATDKILAMMKLRSMISTKKLGPEDTKQTTHIAFPLNEKEITKLKAIPTYYSWKDKDPEPIENFITSYKSLGKLAKTKISWVITKMHNPKELAKLTLTTEKRSDERNEVRALLKFIQANPITPDSEIIGAIINKNKKNTDYKDPDFRVYTLNVTQFLSNVHKSPGVKLTTDFSNALDIYTQPNPNAFKSGLSSHGNKLIEQYNKALKELMENGSINGEYPAQTSDEKLDAEMQEVTKAADTKLKASTDQYKRTLSDQENILKFLKTVIPKLLETFKTKEPTTDETFDLSRNQFLTIAGDDTIFSNYPDNDTAIMDLIRNLIPALSHKNYLKCSSHLREATKLPDVWILGFKQYIDEYEKEHPSLKPESKTQPNTPPRKTADNSNDPNKKLPGGFFEIKTPKK